MKERYKNVLVVDLMLTRMNEKTGKEEFLLSLRKNTGSNDGEYELGGQKVIVKGRLATLESGTIAGSATNLYDCMKTCVQKMEIPLEDAIKCATYNPARSIGILDKAGSIEDGKKADLLLVDQNLNLKAVLLRGKWLKFDL